MLDALMRAVVIMANRAVNPFHLAGGNRRADAAAAGQNPALGSSIKDRAANRLAEIGVIVGLSRVDPLLVAAARGLGAGPWQAFWRVTWPLSLPGILAAGELTLLWALAAVLGPLLLGGPQETTLGVEVQRQALEYHRWPRAAALAVGLLFLLVLAVGLVFRGRREARR